MIAYVFISPYSQIIIHQVFGHILATTGKVPLIFEHSAQHESMNKKCQAAKRHSKISYWKGHCASFLVTVLWAVSVIQAVEGV